MSTVPSKPVADVLDTDVVQLVVHGAMFPGIVNWLLMHGFEVSPFEHEENELDTYMVASTRRLRDRSGFFRPTSDDRDVERER